MHVRASPADALRLSHGVPLAHAVRTDVGRVRGNNEDSHGELWLDDGSLLLVVCDGMGGHEAGEVASQLAVDTIVREVQGAEASSPAAVLHAALLAANQEILAEGKAAGKRGMGTTAIVAWVRGREAWIGQVGDSRLYLARDGVVLDRSVDHTRVQVLLTKGLIKAEEARDHPESGMLTRALGHARMANGLPFEPEVYAAPILLQDGDALVLATDGLHDLVGDGEIAHALRGSSPEVAAERLVALALERGGHDNVTVTVLTVGERAAGATMPTRPEREDVPTTAPVEAARGGWWIAGVAMLGGMLLFAAAFLLGVLLVGGGG